MFFVRCGECRERQMLDSSQVRALHPIAAGTFVVDLTCYRGHHLLVLTTPNRACPHPPTEHRPAASTTTSLRRRVATFLRTQEKLAERYLEQLYDITTRASSHLARDSARDSLETTNRADELPKRHMR